MPFRDAHEAVAKAVRMASDRSVALSDLPLEELRGFSNLIEADVTAVLTLEGSVDSRNHFGGTAPVQVRAAVQRHRASAEGAPERYRYDAKFETPAGETSHAVPGRRRDCALQNPYSGLVNTGAATTGQMIRGRRSMARASSRLAAVGSQHESVKE
jgi:hypothetical protein